MLFAHERLEGAYRKCSTPTSVVLWSDKVEANHGAHLHACVHVNCTHANRCKTTMSNVAFQEDVFDLSDDEVEEAHHNELWPCTSRLNVVERCSMDVLEGFDCYGLRPQIVRAALWKGSLRQACLWGGGLRRASAPCALGTSQIPCPQPGLSLPANTAHHKASSKRGRRKNQELLVRALTEVTLFW